MKDDVASLVDEIIAGKGYVLIPELLSPTQAEEARSRYCRTYARSQIYSKSASTRISSFQAFINHPLINSVDAARLVVRHRLKSVEKSWFNA